MSTLFSPAYKISVCDLPPVYLYLHLPPHPLITPPPPPPPPHTHTHPTTLSDLQSLTRLQYFTCLLSRTSVLCLECPTFPRTYFSQVTRSYPSFKTLVRGDLLGKTFLASSSSPGDPKP